MSEHGTHILVLGCAAGKSEREEGNQSSMIFQVENLRGDTFILIKIAAVESEKG